jgi:hypothetical protein
MHLKSIKMKYGKKIISKQNPFLVKKNPGPKMLRAHGAMHPNPVRVAASGPLGPTGQPHREGGARPAGASPAASPRWRGEHRRAQHDEAERLS